MSDTVKYCDWHGANHCVCLWASGHVYDLERWALNLVCGLTDAAREEMRVRMAEERIYGLLCELGVVKMEVYGE
jgi:hypothetical protein